MARVDGLHDRNAEHLFEFSKHKLKEVSPIKRKFPVYEIEEESTAKQEQSGHARQCVGPQEYCVGIRLKSMNLWSKCVQVVFELQHDTLLEFRDPHVLQKLSVLARATYNMQYFLSKEDKSIPDPLQCSPPTSCLMSSQIYINSGSLLFSIFAARPQHIVKVDVQFARLELLYDPSKLCWYYERKCDEQLYRLQSNVVKRSRVKPHPSWIRMRLLSTDISASVLIGGEEDDRAIECAGALVKLSRINN